MSGNAGGQHRERWNRLAEQRAGDRSDRTTIRGLKSAWGLGRPPLSISVSEAGARHDRGMSWAAVAQELGVSRSTLLEHRQRSHVGAAVSVFSRESRSYMLHFRHVRLTANPIAGFSNCLNMSIHPHIRPIHLPAPTGRPRIRPLLERLCESCGGKFVRAEHGDGRSLPRFCSRSCFEVFGSPWLTAGGNWGNGGAAPVRVYPFLEDRNTDEARLLEVSRLIPRSLPEHIRSDVGQDALLILLEGTVGDAQSAVSLAIKRVYGEQLTGVRFVSLDNGSPNDERPFLDRLNRASGTDAYGDDEQGEADESDPLAEFSCEVCNRLVTTGTVDRHQLCLAIIGDRTRSGRQKIRWNGITNPRRRETILEQISARVSRPGWHEAMELRDLRLRAHRAEERTVSCIICKQILPDGNATDYHEGECAAEWRSIEKKTDPVFSNTLRIVTRPGMRRPSGYRSGAPGAFGHKVTV